MLESSEHRLPYRGPLDFAWLLTSYASHQIGDLEIYEPNRLRRRCVVDGVLGEVTIENVAAESVLRVTVDDVPARADLLDRVRAMFDLDIDPDVLTKAFAVDPDLEKLWRRYPGLRMPSGWDPFEVAMVTILGQLVSVTWGRALLHQLIEIAGRPTTLKREGRVIKLFPTPADVLAADLTPLKTTGARKLTLKAFCHAMETGQLSLARDQSAEDFTKRALAIRGIGPWSANYMALRVLRHADAFPATDLILARALAHHPPEAIARVSPWRGYAATLLWREYAESLSKAKPRRPITPS